MLLRNFLLKLLQLAIAWFIVLVLVMHLLLLLGPRLVIINLNCINNCVACWISTLFVTERSNSRRDREGGRETKLVRQDRHIVDHITESPDKLTEKKEALLDVVDEDVDLSLFEIDEDIDDNISIFEGEISSEFLDLSIPSEALLLVESLCGCKYSTFDTASIVDKLERIQRSVGKAELIANANAVGTVWPPELYVRDGQDLHAYASLSQFIRAKQEALGPERFNPERCHRFYTDDEEFDRLLDLATNGAVIDTADDFVACCVPSKPRALYSRIPLVLKKHILKLWREGKGVIIPLADILHERPHVNDLHWVGQDPVAKPEGRLLGDLTNKENGDPLNNPHIKPKITERFGKLNHPSIFTFMRNLVVVADQCGGIPNVRLLKSDIKSAFAQFLYHCESARLLTFDIGMGLVFIYLVGLFGWTGSPQVFGILTRAIVRLIYKRLAVQGFIAETDGYCDDFITFAPEHEAQAVHQIVNSSIVDTCGKGQVCEKKDVPPCMEGDVLGYWVNLNTADIRPNQKGINSLAKAFLLKPKAGLYTTKQYQSMASLACRYSRVMKGFRPMVSPLYRMINKRRKSLRVAPSEDAQTAIMMWQAVTICLLISPDRLAVPVRSLLNMTKSCHFRIISDAGPRGLGLAIYDREDVCIGYVSYRLPFDASDPAYQNAREYMGFLLGKILLFKLRIANNEVSFDISADWTGDNMSSLSWVRKEACRSSGALLAFLAEAWFSTMYNITTGLVSHRAGVDMGDHDSLSRFWETSFDKQLNLAHLMDENINDLFRLCDPTVGPDSGQFSLTSFTRIVTILDKLDNR